MNPDLDKQGRRSAWPNPADTALDRARKIAQMYRAHLQREAPVLAGQVDALCVGYGEDWMVEKPDIVDGDAELTTTQAAELARVPPERITKWACTPHPEKPGQMLLPRFKKRGRERTYLAIHVLAAASCMRRRTKLAGAGG